MNLGVEGAAHLPGIARKLDQGAPGRYAADLEAMRLQPRRHRRDVGVGGTKLLAKLLRSEPLTVARRRFALLLVQQRFERGLLGGTALQQQEHAADRLAVGDGALIELRPRQRV